MKHSYRITHETVVEDNHRLYEIIVARTSGGTCRVYRTRIKIRSSFIAEEPTELSVAKWNRMNRKNKEILEQLQRVRRLNLKKLSSLKSV